MKRLSATLTGIIFLFVSGCYPILGVEGKDYRRLILIPDVDKNSDVLLSDLLMTGIAQAAPIAITVELFKEYLDEKKTTLENININPTYLKAAQNIGNQIRSSTKQVVEKFEAPFIHKRLILYQFLFLENDWYLFDIPGTSLLLLVPKKYLNQITGSNQLGNPQQAGEKLGFFLDGKQIALPKQNITESNQLKPFEDEFLAITQQKPKAFKSEHLKKLLRPSPVTNDAYAYSWNIFATGHGTAPEPIIMGMNSEEFEQMLIILNSYVHTNFFYYVTCYGGSEESLGKPYLKFKGIKDLNYIVASGATTDAPVLASWFSLPNATYIIENGILIPKPMINYNEFFNLLEQQGTFEKALKAITPPLAKSIPLVRFPGTEVFSASKLDNSVAIINKVNNFAALVDNKEFTIQDKIALIVYPQVVSAPINLNNDKPIEVIFMDPSSSPFLGNLKVKNINNLFYSGIHTQTSSFHNIKYIYIDKLIFPSKFTSNEKGIKENSVGIKLEDKKKGSGSTDITNLFAKNGDIVFNSVVIQLGDPLYGGSFLGAARPEIYIRLPAPKRIDDRYFKGSYITPNFTLNELFDENAYEFRDIQMLEQKVSAFKLTRQDQEQKAAAIRSSGFLKRAIKQ